MSALAPTFPNTDIAYGRIAFRTLGTRLLLRVLPSSAGFYIGTIDEDGPASRESVEYYPTFEAAQIALLQHTWTQRPHA